MQQHGRYRPDLTDFIEGSNLAGMPNKMERYHHSQMSSPLANRPRHEAPRREPLRRALVPSSAPRQAAPRTMACNHTLPNWQVGPLPTPPHSPFKFIPCQTSAPYHNTPQSLVRYASLSGPLIGDHKAPPFATPASRIGPVFGSTYLGTSLMQAMDFQQSPNKFVVSADDGIDPFIDQTVDKTAGGLQNTAPTNTVSLYTPFRPSRALLDMPRTIDPVLASMAQHVGIDLGGNYKGDITKEHIYNAIAPVHDNCALHIIGLPADIALNEVFSEIVGKVFSFQLHSPVPGKWTGCGARLVFTNRAAAEEFYWRARTGLGIIVRGHQIRVLWNRDPCRPQHYADRHQSRVLQIKGPNNPIFSAEEVEQFFAKKLLFKLVDRKEWLEAGGLKVVELHFPSILGQSRPAMKQFYEWLDETDQRSVFKIQYAPDPCDPTARSTISWDEFRF